ncbi:carbohydrate-binding family V/XII [Aquabacter cavernae]|uniref:carbohydrate-binding family V/XII n=1 Tax=Aquabacter cavernae TaxID=2496029 RepID=UPI0013DE941F|nr:carbohydrate-binding family V/XII [Aquabacter cavernae]
MDTARLLAQGRLAGRTAMVALAVSGLALPLAAYAQPAPPAQQGNQNAPLGAAGIAWPRTFDLGDSRLEIYQPQIETWDGNSISGRSALAIGPKDGTPTYGFAHFVATATIDKAAGLVQLSNITVDKVEVVTAAVKAAIDQRLPKTGLVVRLDQLQASYAVNQKIAELRTQPVDNTPPRIVFTDTATILVPVSGEPSMRSVDGAPTYQRVINSRALILQDSNGVFHLQAAGTWYQTGQLTGTFVANPNASDELQAATKAALKQTPADPLLNKDGKPVVPPPAILVSMVPTELVQTNGPAQMLPVAGTQLLSMSNADHAVFMETATNTFYVLISGRWFKAPGTDGPWTFVASNALPADFAKISPKDPQANVLVSVSGTPQAKEAAIAATIPQTSTVQRNATTSVTYSGGAPQFAPIEGTALKYAVNTPNPVIMVGPESYYVAVNGVWFTARTPTGPWVVAAQVPPAIYTIPVASPVHYVTYVRVYSVQPETVVVGYTPGYMGVMVAPGGTVVYGTGYSCTGWAGVNYWYSCPATYGYGAGFALGSTVGFGFGFAAGWAWGAAVTPFWGPYWGAAPYGHWGYTNVNQANIYGRWGGSATVTQAWGTTWNGTEWGARSGFGTTAGGTNVAGRAAGGFNPYTGNYAGARDTSRYNPYTGARGASSASVTGNAYTGNFDATRSSAGANPTTGTAHASTTSVSREDGQLSVDSKGVATNQRTGNSVAWNNGNVYADHDGNVYQHDNGQWNRATSSGWQPVDHSFNSQQLDNERQARDFSAQRSFSAGDRFSGGGARVGGGGERFRR